VIVSTLLETLHYREVQYLPSRDLCRPKGIALADAARVDLKLMVRVRLARKVRPGPS
jgi:hypothetical protein